MGDVLTLLKLVGAQLDIGLFRRTGALKRLKRVRSSSHALDLTDQGLAERPSLMPSPSLGADGARRLP
jgi:hypothetical protein